MPGNFPKIILGGIDKEIQEGITSEISERKKLQESLMEFHKIREEPEKIQKKSLGKSLKEPGKKKIPKRHNEEIPGEILEGILREISSESLEEMLTKAQKAF